MRREGMRAKHITDIEPATPAEKGPEPDFAKGGGLVTTVVTDVYSGEVLMVAWMNREAYELTLRDKEMWFWSRSRQELWHKGGTSGNVQRLIRLRMDCDNDTLWAEVKPAGPACHTGARSCFFKTVYDAAFDEGN